MANSGLLPTVSFTWNGRFSGLSSKGVAVGAWRDARGCKGALREAEGGGRDCKGAWRDCEIVWRGCLEVCREAGGS